MIKAVEKSDKTALARYGMAETSTKANCVVIRRNGRKESMFIDPNHPDFVAASTMVRDDKGCVERVLDLGMVGAVMLTKMSLDDYVETAGIDDLDDFLP